MATDSDDMWREGDLVQRHRHLLVTGFMSDCTFLVGVDDGEKKRFKCHKFILGHSSSVFYAMFNGGFDPKDEQEVKDCQPEHFQKFLEYMYLDTVELNDAVTAIGVAYTAEKYLVKTLRIKCLEFIKQNFEDAKNVCQVLEFSRLIGAEELQERCIDFIKVNANKILADGNFEHVERATLMTILEQDKLCIRSEVDLFSACLRWARSNNNNDKTEDENEVAKAEDENGLAKTLGPALKLIRFLTFTINEFASLVVPIKILREKTCLAILCHIITGNRDIPDEVSNCCVSRAILESLAVPIAYHSTQVLYSSAHVGGAWSLTISTNVAALYLHGVQVLGARYRTSAGEEYEENVKVVVVANGSEQMSESFKCLVKQNKSYEISFKKSLRMMPGIQYVLQLLYHNSNALYLSYRPHRVSQIVPKCGIPFTIAGVHNHINAVIISVM